MRSDGFVHVVAEYVDELGGCFGRKDVGCDGNEFFFDLFLALVNCSFDKSIPIYLLEQFSIIGKNLPVPHPASNTILLLDNSFK